MITISRLTKRYEGRVAVDDVSLDVPAGQFLAVVGQSGSGKSTLLKCVNRLMEPDGGSVAVDGVDVRTGPAPLLRRRIGYVLQGIGLFPHLTVGENIAAAPRLMGWSAADQAARTAELLALVDLPQDLAARLPGQLSGGQRQRVGVARAMAARPSIILMDEPFGALDPMTRDELGQAYRALHDRFGLTTVMVTHDVQEAVLLADRIVVMKTGRVLADGAPRDLLSGHADADVDALMQTPRRQAERVRDLLDG